MGAITISLMVFTYWLVIKYVEHESALSVTLHAKYCFVISYNSGSLLEIVIA